MRSLTKSALALTAFGSIMLTVACATEPKAHDGGFETVEVTVTYRERIALVPGHQLKVTVEDVSLADAPSVVLAESKTVLGVNGPPYRVTLQVPKSQITANHEYAARADIRDPEGNLRFTTDTRHSVLTRGSPNSANITLIGAR